MIVGFNFTKMLIERKAVPSGKIDIKNNVMVTDVKEQDLALGKTKQKGLKFIFDFTASYEPNIGTMNFIGDILYLEDSKKSEEVLAEWQKSKKIPEEITVQLIRAIVNRCCLKALVFSEEINLPPPIPLPNLNLNTPKQEKTEKKEKK